KEYLDLRRGDIPFMICLRTTQRGMRVMSGSQKVKNILSIYFNVFQSIAYALIHGVSQRGRWVYRNSAVHPVSPIAIAPPEHLPGHLGTAIPEQQPDAGPRCRRDSCCERVFLNNQPAWPRCISVLDRITRHVVRIWIEPRAIAGYGESHILIRKSRHRGIDN